MNIDFRNVEELSVFGKQVDTVFLNEYEIWSANKGLIGLRAYSNNEIQNFKYSDIKKYQGDIHTLQYRSSSTSIGVLDPFQLNEFLSSNVKDEKQNVETICELVVTNPQISSIGGGCFYKCSKISSATIPTIKCVCGGAFNRAISMTDVYCPNLISVLGNGFYYCESLSSITTQNVKTIYGNAFSYCKKLVHTNTDNVSFLGDGSFSYCNELSSIELPNIVFIGDKSFYNCQKLQRVRITEDNKYYSTLNDDSMLFDKNISILYWASLPLYDRISLPDTVTKIGKGVFAYDANLTSINTGNVIEFQDNAFYYCKNLSSLNCDKLQKCGQSCFAYSKIISADFPNLTSMGTSGFFHSSITYIKCPELTSVESQTFKECYGFKLLDFGDRLTDTIPKLADIGAFQTITADYEIVVPERLYDNWIIQTNWSHPDVISHITYR